MEISAIEAGQVVSFKLVTKLLKDEFTAAKVIAIGRYSVAMLFEDVAAIHANILSDLPADTPKSPEEYSYVIVELMDGTRKAVGMPWIIGPVELIAGLTIVTTVKNASAETVDIVKRALYAYGITDFNIEVKATTL